MPTNKKLKRTSYACSICCYRTDSATSLGNHKREHDKQLQKENEFECGNMLQTNVDSALDVSMPNIDPNLDDYEHCTQYVPFYETTMDDLEELVVNDCYGLMNYDENDVIDYEDDDDDVNIT